jgi:hypothetical protein
MTYIPSPVASIQSRAFTVLNLPAQEVLNVKVTTLISGKLGITNATITKGRVTVSGQYVITEIDRIAAGEVIKLTINTVTRVPVADANAAVNAIAEGIVDGNKVVVAEKSVPSSSAPVSIPSSMPKTGEGVDIITLPTLITIVLSVLLILGLILFAAKRLSYRHVNR